MPNDSSPLRSFSTVSSAVDWTATAISPTVTALTTAVGIGLLVWITGHAVGNPGIQRDLKALVLAVLFLCRQIVFQYLKLVVPREAYAYAALATVAQCSYAFGQTESKARSASGHGRDECKPSFLRPMIFPGRTTHARLFPEKHSFSYSYLYVGIPIGDRRTTGKILAADSPIRQHGAWFSVVAGDYLQRGWHVDGLRGKLRDYLISQNVSPADYPFAYLATAPRFLGFSFNPVSFWYLYDKDHALNAMILEVNNTFDERRMYFMPRAANETKPVNTFANEWSKDFHVSPFNDRDGSYSLSAIDPFHPTAHGKAKVDNLIVLRSPEGKAKITARIVSTEDGLDANSFSEWHTIAFVARWWWVGFATNPRILREARILWVKKLKVFYRPEVFATSIGRNETPEETVLERFFSTYLQTMADICGVGLEYIPAAGPNRAKCLHIESSSVSAAQAREENQNYATIKMMVLTPAFYAELVRHDNLLSMWQRVCFDAAPGEAMVHVSNSEHFQTHQSEFLAKMMHHSRPQSSSLTQKLNRQLRKGVSPSNHPPSSSSDIRESTLTVAAASGATPFPRFAFDEVIRTTYFTQPQPPQLSAYSTTLTRFDRASLTVLLADRIAFGFTSLLKLYVWTIWSTLILFTAIDIRDLVFRSAATASSATPPAPRSARVIMSLPVLIRLVVEVLLLQLSSLALAAFP